LRQIQGINPARLSCRVTIVPVLAEKAIKGAGLIKDGQVLITIFSSLRIGKPGITSPGSTGTDPISDAVGGQGIIIPTDLTFPGIGTFEPIFCVDAQSAISPALWGDTALVGTKTAPQTNLILRRLTGKVKWLPRLDMCLLYNRQNLIKILANTIQAKFQGFRNEE
jgi:hypothetical protein